jgi:hypothetical protein
MRAIASMAPSPTVPLPAADSWHVWGGG